MKSIALLLLSLGLAAALPVSAQTGAEIPIEVEGAEIDETQIGILLFDGSLYLEEGNWQAAIGAFQAALQLDPSRLESHLNYARAITMAVLSDAVPDEQSALYVGEALRQYRWVLDKEPDQREALDALRLLAQKFSAEEKPRFQSKRARQAWEIGDRAMSESRYEDAVRAFREAVQVEPGTPGARRSLAEALRLNGQIEPAQVLFQKELIQNPQDFRAHTGLGQVYEALGKRRDALDSYRFAHKIDPGYPPAWDGIIRILGGGEDDALSAEDKGTLGMALVAAQDWKRAERILTDAVAAADDADARLLKALGVAKYFQSKTRESIGLFNQAHLLHSDDLEILYYLGAAHLRLGNMDRGREYLKSVLATDSMNPNANKLLGLSLSDVPGRESEAIDYLTRAQDMGAAADNLPCILGSLNLRLGEDAEARRQFQTCLDEDPDYAPAHLGMGILADQGGRRGETIIHLERYLALAPPQPGVLIRLGVAYLRENRDEDGYRTLGGIFEIDSAFAPPEGESVTETHLLEMASFYLATVRSYDDAIFIGEKLLGKAPENPVYNNNLAMVYADANLEADRAHALALKATELEPENPGHIDTLGWTLLRLGRFEEAETQLLRSIDLTPEPNRDGLSEVFYHLGLLYRLQSRDQEAEEWLRKALKNPPTPFLRDEIESLLEP